MGTALLGSGLGGTSLFLFLEVWGESFGSKEFLGKMANLVPFFYSLQFYLGGTKTKKYHIHVTHFEGQIRPNS